MNKLITCLILILTFSAAHAQYKEYVARQYGLKLDTASNQAPEPFNNKIKQAALADNGKIKIYVSDERYSSTHSNAVTGGQVSNSRRRVVEYILTEDNKLIKLNYKHLRKLIKPGDQGFSYLRKAGKQRYIKYLAIGGAAAGIAYMARNIGSSSPLIFNKSSTGRDGLIGSVVVIYSTVSFAISRIKNRMLLYDAVAHYNHAEKLKK
ncbi:MAG: hypothetical protein IT257_03570 [Chitinophagaceae bacterium]|nr:hypothetical protein [Chitinophagaceae bacterium]